MRIEKTTFHKSAHTFNIFDDNDEIIAWVEDERLARQFAAAPEMLEICKLLPNAEDDSQLLRVLIDKAREVVKEME